MDDRYEPAHRPADVASSRLQQFVEGTIGHRVSRAGSGTDADRYLAYRRRCCAASATPGVKRAEQAGCWCAFSCKRHRLLPGRRWYGLIKRFRTERHLLRSAVARRRTAVCLSLHRWPTSASSWRTPTRLHGKLSGPATRKLAAARRASCSATLRYARLATISRGPPLQPAPRRRLSTRAGETCRTKTRSAPAPASARAARPRPRGAPASFAVDSVHQGDQRWRQGRLSDQRRGLPSPSSSSSPRVEQHQRSLSAPGAASFARRAFRSRILGFHADNGSEYINHQVARDARQAAASNSPSRARATRNDNALGRNQERRRSSASIWATPTSRNAFRRRASMTFCTRTRSARTSTSIAPASSPTRSRSTARGKTAQTLPAAPGHDDPVRETGQPLDAVQPLNLRPRTARSAISTPPSGQHFRQRRGRPAELKRAVRLFLPYPQTIQKRRLKLTSNPGRSGSYL